MTKTIDIIRRLRSLPMTQAEISSLTGIPQPRICRWEAGSIPVGADDALKLQALLTEKISAKHAPSGTTTAPVAVTPPDMDDHRTHSLRRTHADSPYDHSDIDRRAEEGPTHLGRRASNGHPGDAESAQGV